MAIKHQEDCYRTIKGVRWPNLMDVLSAEHEAEIAALRAGGVRLRIFTHPDGFKRAFVHPDDLPRA